jgi:hypothetical protein
MIYILIENHAHRLLQNGVVESASIETKHGITSILDNWKIRNPVEDLDIDPSDFNYIRQQLEILHSMFPTGRPGVPKPDKVESIAQNYNVEKV